MPKMSKARSSLANNNALRPANWRGRHLGSPTLSPLTVQNTPLRFLTEILAEIPDPGISSMTPIVLRMVYAVRCPSSPMSSPPLQGDEDDADHLDRCPAIHPEANVKPARNVSGKGEKKKDDR